MDIAARFYPALAARQELPVYYTPACFLLAILPFLTENKRLVSILTFPLLLYLCASWPYYTTGDPASDYYNNSHFIAMPMWYLDFVFLTPRDGENAPAVTSTSLASGNSKRNKDAVTPRYRRWTDLPTFLQRVQWAFRLMLPVHRGIGWNWQVKGIRADPYVRLPKWQYVSRHLFWTLLFYAQSVVALTVLGLAHALSEQLRPERFLQSYAATVVLGWSGAWWVWNRLSCAYSLAAALGVATGLTGIWEWPPLMGSLKNAWSVRRMWSSTYHQVCRRLLSQPPIRLVRFFNLRKGGLASSYIQLFSSFGISCLFHQAQMFNVARRDMGELSFFMSQPLAIVAEDVVSWAWRKVRSSSNSMQLLERLVGHLWTFAWFSFSLHLYIDGLVQARVMKDWLFGYKPLQIGADVGQWLLLLMKA